ncbi:MAG: P-II family nitrogen regulator [Methanophagales archaeon ANME-1-THS]|nr:MAG: P-II family nitrogen regulator [Methanophagales archaeon ANME-1-THS]
MKKIEAIIRPEKLDDVKRALEKEGFPSMNLTEIRGRGRQKGAKLTWRGTEYLMELIPKTKLDLVVRDEDTKKVVSIIRKSAYTGNIGDGKIFVLPVEEAIRVRTGEEGEEAL